ncbi:NAD(P)/FAD-dependent oxidoreductase [Fodinibacter luteus]|uniref:NAD(P)/FAD-dependent oxidoreductase n=1 Tax=Fodinibacter luteus TaxID=552064 RepID=A0ABP8KDD0_9MICO
MTRVVLVGGGYVTIHAYAGLVRRLRRRVRSGEVEVVVLTADPSHSFHGFTGEVLAGILPYERTRTLLTTACPLARVVHAVVTEVDRERRTVTYVRIGDAPHCTQTLAWDHLVVGTGGREPASRVPGLAEHGFTLRAPGDIERLAARVAAGGSPTGEHGPTVVVAGGGLAGVELAAAIADRGGHRVELVHAGPSVLPELADQPRLVRRAEAELARLGVVLHLGVRLAEVTATSARLSDGTVLATRTVVATTGQRPVPVPGLGDELRDLQGRLTTAPDLSVADRVWSAGDAARVAHPRTGDPVPANALWAIKAGHHLGDNVARTLLGHPTRPFAYRGLGRAASFGMGRSVSELYGVPFTGLPAWLLRLAFFLRFMPSRRTAAATLVDVVRASSRRRQRPDAVAAPLPQPSPARSVRSGAAA